VDSEILIGYELSSDGEILEIAPTGLEPLFEEIVETDDPENIDMRRQNAISKYMKYGATTSDKKDAIRELAGVLEFLKKSGIRLQKKDESDLFRIINNFDIRHHNKSQQGEYDKEIWYGWMFYTFLSSINVLLKLKVEKMVIEASSIIRLLAFSTSYTLEIPDNTPPQRKPGANK